jgi:hypothetical protein
VVWKVRGESAARSSELAQQIFVAAATHDLHLALVELPLFWFEPETGDENAASSERVTCLRSTLMKPEHQAWLGEIWNRLIESRREVLGE